MLFIKDYLGNGRYLNNKLKEIGSFVKWTRTPFRRIVIPITLSISR